MRVIFRHSQRCLSCPAVASRAEHFMRWLACPGHRVLYYRTTRCSIPHSQALCSTRLSPLLRVETQALWLSAIAPHVSKKDYTLAPSAATASVHKKAPICRLFSCSLHLTSATLSSAGQKAYPHGLSLGVLARALPMSRTLWTSRLVNWLSSLSLLRH